MSLDKTLDRLNEHLSKREPWLDTNEILSKTARSDYFHESDYPGWKYRPGKHVNAIMSDYYRERWLLIRLQHNQRSAEFSRNKA